MSLNWWGSNSGPSIEDISGSVTSSPWLYLIVTTNPVFIGNKAKSTIVAYLIQDSQGTYYSPFNGHLPNGMVVTFSTTMGTINQSSLVNGTAMTSLRIAMATLTSGTKTGIAIVSTKLDYQIIQTPVIIQDIIPPTATASPVGGFYNTTKTVTLKMSEAGTIYYTLNGIKPTTTSTKYTGPIKILKTTTLKYLAVDLAGNKSPVYTQTYIIDKIPPKVAITSPKNGATGFSRTATIAIKFSENI